MDVYLDVSSASTVLRILRVAYIVYILRQAQLSCANCIFAMPPHNLHNLYIYTTTI